MKFSKVIRNRKLFSPFKFINRELYISKIMPITGYSEMIIEINSNKKLLEF